MEALIITTVLTLIQRVAEISDNMNDPNYKPPSADDLRELAKQIKALPDLPTK
jgi:hypothetical protein